MLSTAFLTHSEVYDQVDLQGCVRVDSGTGVTQNPSTDFIRVVRQTSRNQFQKPYSWVRMNQTSSKDKRTARKVLPLSGQFFSF